MPKAATKPQVASKPKPKPPKETKPVGRPPRWDSVEQLQQQIDAYFASCDPHFEEMDVVESERKPDGSLRKDENGQNVYFKSKKLVMTKQKPYTVSGLARALGTTRQTLLEYEGLVPGREKTDDFADTIKMAKLRCQEYAEANLFAPTPQAGTIFNLKNNYPGWVDKTEQDITSGGKALGAGKPSEEAMALLEKAFAHGNKA